MKIWPVFSFVLVMHLVIIGLFLVQPGCQNQPAGEPNPSITQPATGSGAGAASPGGERSDLASPGRPAGQLDPAFNGGMNGEAAGSGLQAPRRPESAGIQRSEPAEDGLEPVLEPVRQSVPGVAPGREYTVQAGDTLAAIAQREGIALDRLLASNGLDRDSTIYVGQSLLIPEAAAPGAADEPSTEAGAAEPSMEKTIEVARGDTLIGLAMRHDTTVAALQAANELGGETIYVGQRLRVPGGASPEETTEANSRPDSPGSGPVYEVQAGDTPSGIARRYGITARELMRANGIRDPRKLFVGQSLRIPGQSPGGAGRGMNGAQARSPQPERAASGTGNGGESSSSPEEASAEPARRDSEGMGAPRRPAPEPEAEEEEEDDPLSALEALEADDLPFVEVEESETTSGEEAPDN